MKHHMIISALAVICSSLPALAVPAVDSGFALTRPVDALVRKTTATVATLKIENAFTRPTLGGTTVAIGYMTIVNSGGTPDKLLSITSDISAESELHESIMQGGVMEMRELPHGLAIPAKSEVAFKPGSYHVMFVGLKRAVEPNETIHAILTFEKAGKVSVNFTATSSPGATKPDSMRGMNMGGMKMP
jgi:periplasmic copper chaperone A